MRLLKSLVIFGCFLCVALCAAQAQETSTATPDQQETTNEIAPDQTLSDPSVPDQIAPDQREPNQRPPCPYSNSTNAFVRLLYNPLRRTLDSARRFIGNRIENVQNGIDLARLQTYKVFMRLYNKTYSAEELPKRMALFFRRRDEIEQSVKAFMEGKSLFAMKENAFADWNERELKKLTGVSIPSPEQLEEDERYAEPTVTRSFNVSAMPIDMNDEDPNITVKAEIPVHKDWSNSGCVSTPINQRECGACYAIATMSVVESMKCIKQSSAPILSSQQIVDCSTPSTGYKNYGCDGGWPTRVLKYLQDVGVAAREKCYPFKWRQESCKVRQLQSVKGCVVGASTEPGQELKYKVLHNERDIQYHVATTGPVITVMKASDKFLYYGKGIFDDPTCSNRRDDVDHAIVITGYGKENGVDYWIIKNSWGIREWGIDGYAKYRRNKNACSIGHWGWVVTR